jgi:hypothetical protein
LEEFIKHYYLIIKKDNKLRQFILLHMSKLIVRLKDLIERQLLLNMNKLSFDESDEEFNNLVNKLSEKETEILKVNPDKVAIDNTEEILTTDNVLNIRNEILNDLKNTNEELESLNWI